MDLNISLAPDVLFFLGGFPVTNTFIWSLVISPVFNYSVWLSYRSLKLIPGKFQNFLEALIEGSYEFVESIMGPGKKAQRVYPFSIYYVLLRSSGKSSGIYSWPSSCYFT